MLELENVKASGKETVIGLEYSAKAGLTKMANDSKEKGKEREYQRTQKTKKDNALLFVIDMTYMSNKRNRRMRSLQRLLMMNQLVVKMILHIVLLLPLLLLSRRRERKAPS